MTCAECDALRTALENARIDAVQERAAREAAERVTDKVRAEVAALRARVAALEPLAADGAKAYMAALRADAAQMRELGLTHRAIRAIVDEHAAGEVSTGKLVDLVRAAARALADDERAACLDRRAAAEGADDGSCGCRIGPFALHFGACADAPERP